MQNFVRKNWQVLTTFGLLILAYVPVIFWMWDRWFARDSYYSHGILIPFVSGYLIWQKWAEIKNTPVVPSKRRGSIITLAGILVYILASLFRVYFVGGFSMFAVLIGLIMYFYGWQVLRKIWVPVALLLFMFPLPLVIITNISFRMKMLAAKIAAVILNHIGIPALREGSMIYMRHAYVVVDDVCSGLRSLISLLALGAIFAYISSKTKVKKWILFFSTVPIAVITNVVRVVILASIAEIWGSQYTKGFVHDTTGFLIFAVAFILLYAVGRLLE
ncbi:MAG: exosortase/archaeosortase family protein [Candidatus Omnitrophica bacterium]|nr:exosortase/archaeosortase family protein [Candidatus Omnitrophota bacterium]